VLNVDEAMAAHHTEHWNMVTEIGAYRGFGTAIKLSRSAPPRFNEHGEAVLRARGFSEAEVAALAREGVLVEKRRKIGHLAQPRCARRRRNRAGMLRKARVFVPRY
jgi:hypothetical protein